MIYLSSSYDYAKLLAKSSSSLNFSTISSLDKSLQIWTSSKQRSSLNNSAYCAALISASLFNRGYRSSLYKCVIAKIKAIFCLAIGGLTDNFRVCRSLDFIISMLVSEPFNKSIIAGKTMAKTFLSYLFFRQSAKSSISLVSALTP